MGCCTTITCCVGAVTKIVVAGRWWRDSTPGRLDTNTGGAFGITPPGAATTKGWVPATKGWVPATKGWVAATKGELAGSPVEENRGATDLKGITTEGVVAVNLSPPAHAGAARASTARIPTTPLRRITPRSTGGPAALFTLTSEFCPARHPTSTRPIGRSRDPRDDSRRGRPAPAAPAPHADSAHRGPRSGRRGASPRGRGRR